MSLMVAGHCEEEEFLMKDDGFSKRLPKLQTLFNRLIGEPEQ